MKPTFIALLALCLSMPVMGAEKAIEFKFAPEQKRALVKIDKPDRPENHPKKFIKAKPKGEVIDFVDGLFGCWSRVKMANGDVVYISVARNSVLFKDGANPFNAFRAKKVLEQKIPLAVKTAVNLHQNFKGYQVPIKMRDFLLTVFTQAALQANSRKQYLETINELDDRVVEKPADLKVKVDGKPLIADSIVEKAIRKELKKPTGELTEADFEKVTELDLGFTKITNEGLKELAKLKQLKFLGLNLTHITDAGLKEVAKLPQLKKLWLNNNEVTKAGVAQLQKALPKCKIDHNAKK